MKSIIKKQHRNINQCINIKNTITSSSSLSSSSSSSSIAGLDEKDLQYFGKKKQSGVSLTALMETGRGDRLKEFDQLVDTSKQQAGASERVQIQVACFLHRELPIRLAHRAVELESSQLYKESPSIRNVCSWYKRSFAQIRAVAAPVDIEKESKFAKVIEDIYERHSATLITMAKGAHEFRTNVGINDVGEFADMKDVQKKLDEFYMSRIGMRMLIGQYLALKQPATSPDMIGLVSTSASPYEIASQAIEDAAYMCRRAHGDAPEVKILGRTDLHFPYVPSHISYMLLELLKNSMRATVETHGAEKMPQIKIIIADGEDNEDVVIKVSDEGGGIKRSNMNRIWSYLFTTADPAVLNRMLATSDSEVRDFDTASPLAGLGYGLPISRNYARYFGGELTIMSMEGYGTDSFIYLPRLGNKNGVLC